MKIKELKTSLSVSFLAKEHLSFKVQDSSVNYPKGLEIHYITDPCGVIIKSGTEEVWVNINNISSMKFLDEVISEKPKKVATAVK
jgi:hypothetical protein